MRLKQQITQNILLHSHIQLPNNSFEATRLIKMQNNFKLGGKNLMKFKKIPWLQFSLATIQNPEQ